MAKIFAEMRAEISLQQGSEQLNNGELAGAETSHRQALEAANTATIRNRVQADWEAYIKGCFVDKDWQCAEAALAALQSLGAASEEALVVLRDDLFERKAQAELDKGQLDAAFDCLANLSDEARPKFKGLVRTYLQDRAQQGKWVGGYAALKCLVDHMPGDGEAITWRANWLFSWAQALFPAEKRKRPLQAKCLCLRILDADRVPVGTPLASLQAGDASPGGKGKSTRDVRQCACALLTEILVGQVRTCLSEGNLPQAESHFQEALGLPFPPEHRLLFGLAKDQLRISLKADCPDQAFSFLNHLKTEAEDGERAEIIKIVRQFGRLYSGRNRWGKAQQALTRLHEWLVPHAQAEVAGLLDDLNRERLEFAGARRKLASRPGEEEIARRQEECEAAQAGYQAAQALDLDTQDKWAEDFIQACLALGEAHLGNDALEQAAQPYQDILKEARHRPEHEWRISQGLHGYCAHKLDQGNWDEAHKAVESLESLDLAAPDDRMRPDPRVAGAIQQVILRQSQAHLDQDQIQEMAAQLSKLPDPWPVGEIKHMIRAYKPKPGGEPEWALACEAARALNDLLYDAREQTHDQETLQWLIGRLVEHGTRLKDQEEIAQAADAYREALERTRAAAHPRSAELAGAYIEMTRRLAQDQLREDLRSRPAVPEQAVPRRQRAPLAARGQSTGEPRPEEISGALLEATRRFRGILDVPEHNTAHEEAVNADLSRHASNLAKAGEWRRAGQALDRLDDLYREKPRYRTQFADWRRDLLLDEVRMWLNKEQLGTAFERLEGLKGWLERYDAPGASWLQNAKKVRAACHASYEKWLKAGKWELAVPAAQHLVSLLPDDEEANGWLVQALFQQGQELRSHKKWEDALARFKEALEIAPRQTTVPEADIQRAALQTRLEQAKQHLDEKNLAGAVDVYEQALQLAGDHPGRANEIREALTEYGGTLIAPRTTPPDWSTAYQVPEYLKKLELYDDQGRTCHQQLVVAHMKAILWDTNDVAAAFAKLSDLPEPWPAEELYETVEAYSDARVETEYWKEAIEALDCLGKALPGNAPPREKVVAKLHALGKRLGALGNKEGRTSAFDSAFALQRKQPA
jgi:tetratricopeptide (TPR) repeat protein